MSRAREVFGLLENRTEESVESTRRYDFFLSSFLFFFVLRSSSRDMIIKRLRSVKRGKGGG